MTAAATGKLRNAAWSVLAVFPGTTHFFGLARTALVLDVAGTFLDAPAAADAA